jgi:hypothetical protein
MCKGSREGICKCYEGGGEEVVQNSLNVRSSAFVLLNSNHIRTDRIVTMLRNGDRGLLYRLKALKEMP